MSHISIQMHSLSCLWVKYHCECTHSPADGSHINTNALTQLPMGHISIQMHSLSCIWVEHQYKCTHSAACGSQITASVLTHPMRKDDPKGGVSVLGRLVSRLEFAGDIALIDQTEVGGRGRRGLKCRRKYF